MFPLLDESDYPFGFFLFTLRKEGSLSPSLPKFYPVVLCLPSGNMATNLVNQGLTSKSWQHLRQPSGNMATTPLNRVKLGDDLGIPK